MTRIFLKKVITKQEMISVMHRSHFFKVALIPIIIIILLSIISLTGIARYLIILFIVEIF